ncbi:histidine phosphatase family protein [Christiangramia fulva]|uniref:Histidine phosphatase family protein n=1 Tax=Christiangramia fulva TaxID=2126553 RepID=A0A2R3Z7D8_9FLAO|nr:histidine phosphatase family protein [Christiangramia fulva]AVR46134.1 histidine phosphatase family protein [Christiangramia fulva]
MKRLVLVRHGKSSWEEEVNDKQRPLKSRAYDDAEKVLKTFQHFYKFSATCWSSPAKRALETAKTFKKALEIPDEDFKIVEELYTFDRDELLNVIQSCPDDIHKLMVFGHNPAITMLVNELGDKEIDNLSTTGLVVIDFDTDSWNSIEQGTTILTLLPKNLR